MASVVLKINDSGSSTGYEDGDIIAITRTDEALLENIVTATPLPSKAPGELNSITELRYKSSELYKRFRYERTGVDTKNTILQIWDSNGTSDPLDGNGSDGDYYNNTNTNVYFIKENGSWVSKGDTTNSESDKSIKSYVDNSLLGVNSNREMYGIAGGEIWFSGYDISNSSPLVSAVWDYIEANSSELRINHSYAKLSDTEFKHFLNVPIDDITETRKAELLNSIEDLTDPENPILTKKRKFCIDIDNLATNHISPVIADIRDYAQRIDIMSSTSLNIEILIIDKTV